MGWKEGGRCRLIENTTHGRDIRILYVVHLFPLPLWEGGTVIHRCIFKMSGDSPHGDKLCPEDEEL